MFFLKYNIVKTAFTKSNNTSIFSTLYMNDTIYKDIIVHWIPHYQRAVLRQNDLWLLPIKRITYDVHYCSLLVDIILHSGLPCKRYCICRYFSNKDKAFFLRDSIEFYPFRFTEKCESI